MKKFCEKCGLKHALTERESRENQFTCIECKHANLGKLKQKLEKISRFEPCPECGLIRKGRVIRKINDVITIEYECEPCNRKWTEQWVYKTLKDRLKNAVKKQ